MADSPEDKQHPYKETEEPLEETEHYDDKVIGRAFRWSMAAVLLLVLGGGAGFWLLRKTKPAPPVQQTAISAPRRLELTNVTLPRVTFSHITRSAGIDFVHNNGAYGEKLLPETMGGGVAFFDFDRDGDQDLYFVNSTYWPGKIPPGKKETFGGLYQNDGKGNFTHVTQGSGLEVSFYGMGAAVGDYDNDGQIDLFVTGVGGNHLFRNEGGGKFRETTMEAGVGGGSNHWSSAAAWMDYNNDGRLDLLVGNYVRWSPEIDREVGYKLVGVGRAYGQPMNFEGTFPLLYRNDGAGKFTEVSAEAGLQIKNPQTGVPAAKTLGIAPIDLDRDGWMDLVLANDTVQNFVFHNQKTGTFKEIGPLSGIAFDNYGATRGAMGIDTGDYRNDGSIAITIGNFANEMTALYVSQKDPLFFSDEALTEGIGPASRLLLKFGIFFFDYDLDGRLDVLSANGHLEEEINKVQESQQYRQPAQLFWNSARNASCFVSVPPAVAGADLFKPMVGRGSAYADIDGDGDLDVVITQIGGAPLLLRNNLSSSNHWIRLELTGAASNRSAIGARIQLRAGGLTQTRQVMASRSYLSQSELPVTFGLESATSIDEVIITWPSGQTQRLDAPKINQRQVVMESR